MMIIIDDDDDDQDDDDDEDDEDDEEGRRHLDGEERGKHRQGCRHQGRDVLRWLTWLHD